MQKCKMQIFLLLCLMMSTHMVLSYASTDKPVLYIGFDPSMPPYQFYENGTYQGLLVDLTAKIFSEMGRDIIMLPMPLDQCIEQFNAGKIDVVLGLRFNAAYAEHMSYSDALVSSTVSIAMLKDKEAAIKDMLGIEPFIIAVERNSTEFEFVKNIKKANFNNAFNQQSVVDLMLLNRADMMVGVRHVAEYLLEKNGVLDDYYFSNSYVTPVDYYMAVDKDRVSLLGEINTELRMLKLNGTYETIYNKWIDDKTVESQKRIQRILRYMAVVLSLVVLGALTTSAISVQLKRRVDEKTRELSESNALLERKIIEIRNTNELRNLIFESSPRSIVIFDNEGRVSGMNEPAKAICHLEDAPIGMQIEKLEPLSYMLEGRLQHILIDGESYSNQEFKVTQMGRDHYYRFVIYPLMDARGGIITIEEITEEKRLKERMAEREKNRALIQIVSGIAHEIRNPLTSIKTYAALLPKKKDNASFQEQFSRVVPNEVDRVNDLIENLIDYVKPRPRNVEMADIGELIHSCVLLFEPTIRDHRIELEVNLSPQLYIKVDRNQIKQVLINLILNAIDAVVEMRPYNTELDDKIILLAYRDGADCVVEVMDNGVGMTRDEIDSMFELFYTTKAKGSGIGMSLSRQLVEENKGTIEVISKKYQGTTIRLRFGGAL